VVTPINAPSRGPAIDHDSARPRCRTDSLQVNTDRFAKTLGHSGASPHHLGAWPLPITNHRGGLPKPSWSGYSTPQETGGIAAAGAVPGNAWPLNTSFTEARIKTTMAKMPSAVPIGKLVIQVIIEITRQKT
jgi:hypothetical protein